MHASEHHHYKILTSLVNIFNIPQFQTEWLNVGKKYTSGPRYWNVPVLVNTWTSLVYHYCLKMWYLRSFERAGVIQKLTILEHQNGLVLSNTCVPVNPRSCPPPFNNPCNQYSIITKCSLLWSTFPTSLIFKPHGWV